MFTRESWAQGEKPDKDWWMRDYEKCKCGYYHIEGQTRRLDGRGKLAPADAPKCDVHDPKKS